MTTFPPFGKKHAWPTYSHSPYWKYEEATSKAVLGIAPRSMPEPYSSTDHVLGMHQAVAALYFVGISHVWGETSGKTVFLW